MPNLAAAVAKALVFKVERLPRALNRWDLLNGRPIQKMTARRDESPRSFELLSCFGAFVELPHSIS